LPGRKKVRQEKRRGGRQERRGEEVRSVCRNTDCKLRKAGCRGFEGCPGYR